MRDAPGAATASRGTPALDPLTLPDFLRAMHRELPPLLFPEETARVLRTTEGALAVDRVRKRWGLRWVKLGRSVRYVRDDVLRTLAEQTKGGSD